MKTNLFAWVGLMGWLGAGASFGCGDDTGTGGSATGGSAQGGNAQGGNAQGGNNGGTGGVDVPTGFDCTAPTGDGMSVPNLKLTPYLDGLGGVVEVIAAPDDPDRLFAVLLGGQIMVIESGAVLPTPFLDIDDKVQTGGEFGLFGVAFHPDYKTNGRFFVHYSREGDGANVVEEYKRGATPVLADPAAVTIALTHPTEESNHNGGAILFGPDGFLYISIGDGGGGGDPECDALNSENLLGKMSRIDVDQAAGAEGFPAAAGNPGGNKWYHLGLRNAWRASMDGCTGDIWLGDVGQNAWEEIDVAKAGSGPLNFGWPVREGEVAYNNTCTENLGPYTEPVFVYDHSGNNQNETSRSVTGGFVWRSSRIPVLRGAYFFADFSQGTLYAKPLNGPGQVLNITANQVAGFGQDGHGEVFVTSAGEGTVLKLDLE
jgi:glucose/arabinose dehydrogenase